MKNSDQFYKRRQKIKISLQVTCVFSVTGSQNRKIVTIALSSVTRLERTRTRTYSICRGGSVGWKALLKGTPRN